MDDAEKIKILRRAAEICEEEGGSLESVLEKLDAYTRTMVAFDEVMQTMTHDQLDAVMSMETTGMAFGLMKFRTFVEDFAEKYYDRRLRE